MPFFVTPMLALVLARPAGLALLALPLLLWLVLRRRDEPRVEATGMLALWRELAAGDPRAAEGGARRLTSRARWLLAGLALGAVAVAGPGPERQPARATYEIVVDRSPSMYLPLAAGGGRPRYEAAVEAAVTWFDEAGVAPESRIWSAAGAPPARGARPPATWSQPPSFPAPELPDALPSTVAVVTDRAREHAGGRFASGGAAVPGLVGEAHGRAVLWRGGALVEGESLAPRRVAVEPRLAPRLARLIEFWVLERGHVVTATGEGAIDLAVRVPEGEPRAVEARGVDWSLEGRAVALPEQAPFPGAWLVDREGAVLARTDEVGTMTVGLVALDDLGGDPAAFAVAWGEALDAALPPRSGVVPLAERADAGAPLREAPSPRPGDAVHAPAGPSPAAWLGLAALLAVALAHRPSLATRGERSPGPPPASPPTLR